MVLGKQGHRLWLELIDGTATYPVQMVHFGLLLAIIYRHSFIQLLLGRWPILFIVLLPLNGEVNTKRGHTGVPLDATLLA